MVNMLRIPLSIGWCLVTRAEIFEGVGLFRYLKDWFGVVGHPRAMALKGFGTVRDWGGGSNLDPHDDPPPWSEMKSLDHPQSSKAHTTRLLGSHHPPPQKEYYFAVMLSPKFQGPTIVASSQGGVEIEPTGRHPSPPLRLGTPDLCV